MSRQIRELKNLDFSIYIGGPLLAAVEAQKQASQVQAAFISEQGFDDQGKIRTVNFEYNKSVPNEDGGYDDINTSVTVPFLTMLTIPSLRIDEMTIDFSVNLVATEEAETTTTIGGGLNFKFWKFRASAGASRRKVKDSTYDSTYSIDVHVRAINDAVPEGLNRILTLLEDNIKAVPAT